MDKNTVRQNRQSESDWSVWETKAGSVENQPEEVVTAKLPTVESQEGEIKIFGIQSWGIFSPAGLNYCVTCRWRGMPKCNDALKIRKT